MNLSRTFTSFLISSKSKNSLLLRSLLLQSSSHSTAAAEPAATYATPKPRKSKWTTKSIPQFKTTDPAPDQTVLPDYATPCEVPQQQPSNWPRPTEVPWQPKVANSVSLVGFVAVPVELGVAPDRRYWAVSALTQDKMQDFPQFWIPIIFESDLAQVAACHLKENDLIYITGQLSGGPPPVTTENGRASIQVMVESLNFVQKTFPSKKTQSPCNQSKKASDDKGGAMRTLQSGESHWSNLLANPDKWWDHRMDKRSGLVSPKYPDFKHKETDLPIWIDRAPECVLLQLKGLHFDVKKRDKDAPVLPMRRTGSDPSFKRNLESTDASWKDYVENPSNWWDNRLSKRNSKQPDFKHKETGEGLWIGNKTPAWVLPKLPPLTPEPAS